MNLNALSSLGITELIIKYGALGIKVCDRWRQYVNFYEDMGDPPFKGATLERLNSYGDYCPENVIWADYVTQNNNRPRFKKE